MTAARWTLLLAATVSSLGCGSDDFVQRGMMDASMPAHDVPLVDAPVFDDHPLVCPPSEPPGVSTLLAGERSMCMFHAGQDAAKTLGVTPTERAALPLRNLIVLVQENRSFDHYLGRLPAYGHTDVDGIPADYTNPNGAGLPVHPDHLTSTCGPGDPPHQWDSVHQAWNNGRMDGFYAAAVSGGGHGQWALGYFDATQLPFYYWLFSTYAMSDRYFAACLGGTWANRDYLYAGGSYGVRDTGTTRLDTVRTVFDQLDDAGVPWGVYTDGAPRQDCLGWSMGHRGVHSTADFFVGLRDATLPPVVFIDPAGSVDEHPVANVQDGEAWVRSIVRAAQHSALWPGLALVFTYDEAGGFFDHVPPPLGCVPSRDDADFDHRGIRVPLAVVSPWARPGYVSHTVHDHTSILRLVQLLHNLPALTDRDANADALLDLFDFSCPHFAVPPEPPPSGMGGCVLAH